MTLMATATAPRPAAVAAVLAKANTWTAARRKSDGKSFFYIAGSNGSVHMTAQDGCTCPAARNSRTGDCKHQQAVKIAQTPAQTVSPAAAATRERLKSYSELFGPDTD